MLDGEGVLAFWGVDLGRLVGEFEVVIGFSTIRVERCQHGMARRTQFRWTIGSVKTELFCSNMKHKFRTRLHT